MYSQSNPAPAQKLSAYDIYIQENIARREALRVKPHPYTPKNEPIVAEADKVPEPVDNTAIAEVPAKPVRKSRNAKSNAPVPDSNENSVNIPKLKKEVSGEKKGRPVINLCNTLQSQPRAGPL